MRCRMATRQAEKDAVKLRQQKKKEEKTRAAAMKKYGAASDVKKEPAHHLHLARVMQVRPQGTRAPTARRGGLTIGQAASHGVPSNDSLPSEF